MHHKVRDLDGIADGSAMVSSGGDCWSRTMRADPRGCPHLSRRGISNNLLDNMASIRALCSDAVRPSSTKPPEPSPNASTTDDVVVRRIVSFYEFLRSALHHESKQPPSDALWPLPFWHGLDMQGKDWQWLRAAHGQFIDLDAGVVPTESPCTLSLTTDGLSVIYIGDVVDGLPHGYGVAFHRYVYSTHPSACGWSEGLWMGGARYALLSCGSDGWHSLMDSPAVNGDSVRGVTTHSDGKRTEAFWHDSILASTPILALEKRRPAGLPSLWTAIAKTPSPPLFDPDRPRTIGSTEDTATSTTQSASLLALPNELLVAILSNLDGFSLGRFSTVCRVVAVLASDGRMWASAFRRSFGRIYDDLLCEFAWSNVDTKGRPLPFARAADSGRSWRWLFRAHASYYDPAEPRTGPCILDADSHVRPYLVRHDSRERNHTICSYRSEMTIYIGDIAIDENGCAYPCGYGVMLKCRDLGSAGQSTERDRVRDAFRRLASRIPSDRYGHGGCRWRAHNYQPLDPTKKRPGLLSWREIIVPSNDRLAGLNVGLLSKGSHRGHVYVGECPSARGEIGYGRTMLRKRTTVVRGPHRSGKPFGRHDYIADDGVGLRVWWTGGGVKSRHMAKTATILSGHPYIRKSTVDTSAKTITTVYANGDRLVLRFSDAVQATLTCSSRCPDRAYASRVIRCENVAGAPTICESATSEREVASDLAICATGKTPDDEALRDYIRRGLMGWGPAHSVASTAFQAHIDALIDNENGDR